MESKRILIWDAFVSSQKWLFFRFYRMPKTLVDAIGSRLVDPRKRISHIKNTYFRRGSTLLISNTAAGLSVLFTTFSVVVASMLVFHEAFDISRELNLLKVLITMGLSLMLTWILTPSLIVYLMRGLSPESYAQIVLNRQSEEEVLAILAYELWALHDQFISAIKANTPSYRSECREFLTKPIDMANWIENNIAGVEWVKNELGDHIYRSKSLIDLASRLLKIQDRELQNHILKFNPEIFRYQIEMLIYNLRTSLSVWLVDVSELKSRLESAKDQDDRLKISQEIANRNSQMYELCNDTIEDFVEKQNSRSKYLEDIISFGGLNKLLISISSVGSTSRSFLGFLSGMSMMVGKAFEENASYGSILKELSALLVRSKSHRGIDMLILIESYCRRLSELDNEKGGWFSSHVPIVLYHLRNEYFAMHNRKLVQFAKFGLEELKALIDLWEYVSANYMDQMEIIYSNFEKMLKGKVADRQGRIVICVFGYSRIVRNTLRKSASLLNSEKIPIFVLRDLEEGMLDTRIMRFELLESHVHDPVEATFSGSDELLLNIVKEDATVLFLAGVEAYDETNNRLFHTNNYYTRVSSILKNLKDRKILYEVWLLAGQYKVFTEFPPPGSIFGGEFYNDQHDVLDVYDFNALGISPALITNKK